jgi:hypothetical protein
MMYRIDGVTLTTGLGKQLHRGIPETLQAQLLWIGMPSIGVDLCPDLGSPSSYVHCGVSSTATAQSQT